MNKVYACSDLHGMYKLWEKIKNFLDETDTLYFLGDAIDRGPDGIKVMKDLLADDRVIYLLGNHENMMLEEAAQIKEGRFFNGLWLNNGGNLTIDAFLNLPEDEQNLLLNKISLLPKTAKYKNKNGQDIFMCHAGTTPGCDEDFYYKRFYYKDAYIWNREHLADKWEKFYEEQHNNLYIVHGHTPTMIHNKRYLCSDFKKVKEFYEDPMMIKYFNNHKINIDLGCFHSNKICLLDLDTLEPIYFKEET